MEINIKHQSSTIEQRNAGASLPEIPLTGSANVAAAELSGGRPKGGGGAPAGGTEHISQEDWAVKLKTA